MAKPIKQRVLKPGVVIAGKYRIEKPIARGGFSVIYRAVHVEMDRVVGLKILQLGDNVRANWLERFSREARLASQLTHQNTVTIFDYGQDERGFLYLAMEWIEGESLYQIFENRGALDPLEVAQIARQILASLDEAHRRGILHRDLKPSNIMLTENYEGKKTVKVLDFGIAKIFEAEGPSGAKITREGGFVGTPRYASPEQLDGAALTPSADIYPVGLLMWEALVGDPAVPGIDFGECVEYHASPEPWRLPESTAVPPELARIVNKALRKSPGERYKSARSMHDDIAAWLGSDEAREGGFGQIAAGGFFAPNSGLAEISSDPVDEPADDLFSDLGTGVPSDEVPMDLEGPGGERAKPGPPPFDKKTPPSKRPEQSNQPGQREEPGRGSSESRSRSTELSNSQPPAVDESPREITSSTGDSHDEERASAYPPEGQQRPSLSDQQGVGAVAGVGPGAPVRSQRAREPGEGDDNDSQLPKIIVGVAIGAIVLAAIVAIVQIATGDDDTESSQRDDSVTADEKPGASEETTTDETEEAVVDDPSTMSVDAILTAMRQSGWRQQGEINRIVLDDGTQHSSLFRAGENSVAVTIFESPNPSVAKDVVRNTASGQSAVRFGTNVVRLRPASGPGKKRATERLAKTLETFKDLGER